MKKILKRFKALRGKADNVALLLLFLDFIARTVDFSDCVCDVDEFEKTFKGQHIVNDIDVGHNVLSCIDENSNF